MTATIQDVGVTTRNCQVLAYLLQGLQYFSLMMQEDLALVRGHIHIIPAAIHAPMIQQKEEQAQAERMHLSSCIRKGATPHGPCPCSSQIYVTR